MPTSILAPTFRKDVKDVAMIDANAYYLACQLKWAQIFAIFIRDLEFQAEKKARPEINPKTVVSKEYHSFLDVLLKKNSDTLPSHQKYDHKFILKEEQKHGYALLYKMLL